MSVFSQSNFWFTLTITALWFQFSDGYSNKVVFCYRQLLAAWRQWLIPKWSQLTPCLHVVLSGSTKNLQTNEILLPQDYWWWIVTIEVLISPKICSTRKSIKITTAWTKKKRFHWLFYSFFKYSIRNQKLHDNSK